MNPPRPTNESSTADPSTLSHLKEEWAELRTLLLAPEQTQLTELRNRIDHTATDAPAVSKVLVEAITLRGKEDDRLTTALTPHVQTALTSSVRRNPHVIADAIAPIMGPAIRQAIVRTLQGMMQSFNQTIDHSLSPKGLAWRIEAWRTGRPFAEVVLLHTLRFRVEQLFLIHRDSGLLLHHVASDNAVVHDHQLISGMLTAIQAFVQDSFGTPKGQTLNTLEIGECRVFIEQGPQAILACVVRGTAPGYLRAQVQQTLESIHLDYGDAFAAFDGNPSGFDATHDRLMDCVQSQYETPRSRISPMTWIMLTALSLTAMVWAWTSYTSARQWDQISRQIGAIPGIVITSLERDGNRVSVSGLRDPLAEDPEQVLVEKGIAAEQITAHWTPFYSLDPMLVEQRTKALLRPAATTTLRYEDGQLTASGTASESWVTRAKQIAPLIPGVREYREDGLRVVSISDLISQVSRLSFFFETGSSTLSETELSKIEPLKALLDELRQSALTSGNPFIVEAIGDADATGPETMNLLLATARAHAVIAALGGKSSYAPLVLNASVNPSSFAGQRRAHPKDAQRRVTLLVSQTAFPQHPIVAP